MPIDLPPTLRLASLVRAFAAFVLTATVLAGGAMITPAAANAADVDGTLDLAKYRGKVVYVDFWASWCGPCRQSFAFLDQLRRSYDNRDVAIVTVNLDRDHKAAENFLRAVGTGLPVVYDPKGRLATQFGVSAMPTSLVIDRDGRQRFVHRGYFDNQSRDYSQHVAMLVAEHH